jgi:hypothetical protein
MIARVGHATTWHRNRGNGVFENQLLQVSRFQDNREFIEATNLAREFDAADQIDRHIDAIPAESIEEAILHILTILRVHIFKTGFPDFGHPYCPSLKVSYLLLLLAYTARV